MLGQFQGTQSRDPKSTNSTESTTDHKKEDVVKLPSEVNSDVFGKLSFADFKTKYQSVWDQITDKDHLITGRITHETKILKTELVVQSMSRREQTAIAMFDPLFGSVDQTTPEVRRDLSAYRIIIQLVRLGQTTFPKVSLTPDNRSSWASDPLVKQQYEYILDLDPIYFSYILNVLNDLDQAKQLALLENLRNP